MANPRFSKWFYDHRHALKPIPSQVALAEIVGVSQEAVSKWERLGVESLSPRTIGRIAAAFDVQPVEVAQALGYPVLARERRPIPLSPIEAMDAAAELAARLAREVEEWASEHFPATDEAQPPGRRNGSLG